jgi:hypothetical protein
MPSTSSSAMRAEVLVDGEALGKPGLERLGGVERDLDADEPEQLERTHRQPERLVGLVDLAEVVAVAQRLDAGAVEPRQHPVDDERGGVGALHGRLAQLLGDVERGRDRLVARRGPDDLEERHDRDGVEEVEADDPLGVLEVGGHLPHRQRRGVGGEHRAGVHDRPRGRRRWPS